MRPTLVINIIGNLIGWGLYFLLLRRLALPGIVQIVLAFALCFAGIKISKKIYRRLN
ncbi:hypothetical protein [Neisseria yangbaofengii]|uniref:hypothetical protein n=1 Tax=Neisseria yangbaofengii TaxID=2709396 RepID=UPI0013E9A7F2|nr:hypothetical protein [Neisseria yangbaofengii]